MSDVDFDFDSIDIDIEDEPIEEQEDKSKIEEMARKQGWVPPDEFKERGFKGKPKTAEEYLEHGSQMDSLRMEIHKLQQQNNYLTQKQKEDAQATRELLEAEYEYRRTKEISDLKKQIKQHMSEGDTDAAEALLEDLDKAQREPKPKPKSEPQQPQMDPELQRLLHNHPYLQDTNDARFKIASEVAQQYQYAPLALTVSKIEDALREYEKSKESELEDKVQNSNPFTMRTPTNTRGGRSEAAMTDEEKEILRILVNRPTFKNRSAEDQKKHLAMHKKRLIEKRKARG